MFDWLSRHQYISGLLAPAFFMAVFLWEGIAVRIGNWYANLRYGKKNTES